MIEHSYSFHETTEQIGSFMHFVFCVPSYKAQGNFPVILLMKSKTKEIHIQTKIHTPLCSRDIKPGYHGVVPQYLHTEIEMKLTVKLHYKIIVLPIPTMCKNSHYNVSCCNWKSLQRTAGHCHRFHQYF